MKKRMYICIFFVSTIILLFTFIVYIVFSSEYYIVRHDYNFCKKKYKGVDVERVMDGYIYALNIRFAFFTEQLIFDLNNLSRLDTLNVYITSSEIIDAKNHPAWLEKIDNIEVLQLFIDDDLDEKETESPLQYLSLPQHIKALNLYDRGWGVTDNDLNYIASFENLETVNIIITEKSSNHIRISTAGVKKFTDLRQDIKLKVFDSISHSDLTVDSVSTLVSPQENE